MTDDLVSWLRAQLDDDERVAQQADGDGEVEWIASDAKEHYLPNAGAHIDRWLPSRALAEVQAKRAILDLHRLSVHMESRTPFDPDTGEPRGPLYEVYCNVCEWVKDDETLGACLTVRLLAVVFSDRPGYQEAWRP